MSAAILFVDDEPNVLQGYRRALRGRFEFATATDPQEALDLIDREGPFGVIVSDMNMPGANGIELLRAVSERSPETVRLMLTGESNLETAVQAVHHGSVFRFLTKPCGADDLAVALDAALRQHALLTAERDLLEKTLKGAVEVMMDMLSSTGNEPGHDLVFIRARVRALAPLVGLRDVWEVETAATLARVGMATVPAEVLVRRRAGETLSAREQATLARVPEIGGRLLAKIPRLEAVSEMVRHQDRNFDGAGDVEGLRGADIPLGARLLKVVFDLAEIVASGLSEDEGVARLRERSARYDPAILDALERSGRGPAVPESRTVLSVRVAGLRVGDVLDADVRTAEGELLIARGHVVTDALRERLGNYRDVKGIREPLTVRRGG